LADLETEPDFDFSPFDIIYVSGGNTFKLMKYAQLTDFKHSVAALMARNGCYIGVSAGSIILSPTIEMAETGENPDPNDVGLTDLAGLGIVPFHMAVHYTEADEPEILTFESLNDCTVMRISDSQAVVIGGEKLKG
jgi:dipeptidase E